MSSSDQKCPSLQSNSFIMKRAVLFFLVQFIIAGFLFSQSEDLMLKTGDKGTYVEHKITPKENFYSIGRLFNVPAKYLAAYNSLDMTKGLNIGQVIRIPLTDTNFSQNVNAGMPVYSNSDEKESLSRISSKNHKVSIENLKIWNNLSGDNSGNNKKLIVGFLTSGELAKANSIAIAKRTESVSRPESVKSQAAEVKKMEADTNIKTKKGENKVPVKEAPEKEEAVKDVKEAAKMVAGANSASGYFKDNFEQQIKIYPLSKEATVSSGIFKTTSGWQDAKYYALMDGVDPGTVIKVTNPSNNKSVFAKVLGAMKGIRQNRGLDIRISDAALPALEISDSDKFIVKVNY